MNIGLSLTRIISVVLSNSATLTSSFLLSIFLAISSPNIWDNWAIISLTSFLLNGCFIFNSILNTSYFIVYRFCCFSWIWSVIYCPSHYYIIRSSFNSILSFTTLGPYPRGENLYPFLQSIPNVSNSLRPCPRSYNPKRLNFICDFYESIC
ncbi:150aa long hypothetical protein [Pyrococcus horikoshii OT3]|uniref:Uncharacterized protein n=1 Tax=Pyrococcus horikoshii (strain ATCC 700860 / DSM 12428 / JCM 9974 / NBRC 100139 / OT-3) TaxID=70601 RepID=O58464_PYRHO|nr:150aa long hypothetical protein [Pyrococcus horikoshii OT3]